MVAPVQIGGGISIGGGINIGTSPSFTLSSADFSNWNSGTFITPNTNTGFTTTGQSGPGEAFYGAYLGSAQGGNPAKLAEVQSFWANNGLATDTNAYMFNVTWGAGSTLSSGVVIMGFYSDPNGALQMGVVDTSNPIWQTPNTGYYSGPILTLAGTWNFPATFTLVIPVIPNGQNWC